MVGGFGCTTVTSPKEYDLTLNRERKSISLTNPDHLG